MTRDIAWSGAGESERIAIGQARDPGKDAPHRMLMRFKRHAGRGVRDDDELVAELPRLPGGRFDAELGRDATQDDRAHAALAKREVEFGDGKRAPAFLGDLEIARFG